MRGEKRYSYYIGDRHIATGTKKQIAAKTGLSVKTLSQYTNANKQATRRLVCAGRMLADEIDCFAYVGITGEPCKALLVTKCDWEKCNFYKPKGEI